MLPINAPRIGIALFSKGSEEVLEKVGESRFKLPEMSNAWLAGNMPSFTKGVNSGCLVLDGVGFEVLIQTPLHKG